MTCLNDSHIQALADGEGSAEMRAHVGSCAGCSARLRDREDVMREIGDILAPPGPMPATLARDVNFRLAAEAQAAGTPRAAGATRLLPRDSRGFRPQAEGHRRWLYGGLGVATATIVAVLFVAPMLRTRDATLSASAILAKSASQLSATITGGVELLEYELVLDGVPKEMMPDGADGTYHVKQAIDHNLRGRFRFASYGPDGRMLTSIAQDPQANRRVMAFLVDGQPYRFEVSLPARDAGLSLPEMERLHMEASITMMQASGNQLVETIDGPQGKLYRIEVPRVSGPGTSPVWDLTEARVLIDARDFRVTEFAVSGSFLKQAYSLSYKLISHSVVGSVAAETFAVPAQPGQIVIAGEGSPVPSHDVVMLSLRELTRLKQGR
jgi:hypothetical protein